MSKSLGFDKLREILLEKDWEEREVLAQKLNELDGQLNERDQLETRVSPIIEDRQNKLQQNFPVLFGPQITESIRRQIKESQEEVIEVLYPIIGRMIKKYITTEIEMLNERVDQQMDLAMSAKGWKLRFKSWRTGTPMKDLIKAEILQPKIESIYVIERDSGMLIASYSTEETIDKDMLAGMLTAIKAFVEDAFTKEKQELESIDYENFKVVLKNFKSFYIAVVTSGGTSAVFRNKLDDQLLKFATKVLSNAKNPESSSDQEMIASGLQDYFNDFENVDD